MNSLSSSSLLLLLAASLASARDSPPSGGAQYRDNNENGPLSKDDWSLGALWRSFLRCCNVPEHSPLILQGLRAVDGEPLITRYNILDWSNFRRLPLEAGTTPQDNAEWMLEKLSAVNEGIKEYQSEAQRYRATRNTAAADEYMKLKNRAEAALPLLRRVHAYYQRKAWVEAVFSYISGTHKRSTMHLQYTDPQNKKHGYVVDALDDAKVVFKRSTTEECPECPERLVMAVDFANDPTLTGTDSLGKPEKMDLHYSVEKGWQVEYSDDRWFKKQAVNVKFLTFQDALGVNTTRGY